MHFSAYTILPGLVTDEPMKEVTFENMSCFENGHIDGGDQCWRSNVL